MKGFRIQLCKRFEPFETTIREKYIIIHVKRGYCFQFVCLSGTLFHVVRKKLLQFSSHSHTNLYHLKAGCLSWVCQVGTRFTYPKNFGVIGLWKRPKITNFNFWSVTTQRVLGPGIRYPYHIWKPWFRSLTGLTQFVRTSTIFVTILAKPLSQIPDFVFEQTCAQGNGALRPLVIFYK